MSDIKEEVVLTICELFKKHGADDYIGEPVTQEEHMIQSAMIAESKGFSSDMIVACLLHDVGHLLHETNPPMGNLGVLSHDKVGGQFLLKNGFNSTVVDLVSNHVNAKRYLLSVDFTYMQKLSDASKLTLAYQGGLMNEVECKQFELRPNFKLYLEMRYIDEEAKSTDIKYKSLEYFRPFILSSLA